MIDFYLETIAQYTMLVIGALIIIKTIAFFTMGSKRITFKSFLYFSDNNLRNTKDTAKRAKKNFQNFLSITILSIILLLIMVFMAGAFFKMPRPDY